MKEVMILALKDRDGHFHACNSFVDKDNIGKTTRLFFEHPVEVEAMEVFPEGQFSSFSEYYKDKYTFTYLKALVDFTDEEVNDFNAGDIRKHLFHKRKVQAVEEILNPFEKGYEVFLKKLKKEGYTSKVSNIRYELLTWLPMFGFRNEREFSFYKALQVFSHPDMSKSSYDFSVTRFNLDYMEKALDNNIELERCFRQDALFGFPEEELMNRVNSFSDDAFASFHRKTSMGYLREADQKRVDKAFFERVVQMSENRIAEYIPDMPERVILEYGADYLLEKAFPEMDYMLKANEYEPEDYIEYEYGYEYHFHYDGRDDELELIENVLPHVTEKSLPLLKQLVEEKIMDHLSPEMKRALLEKES